MSKAFLFQAIQFSQTVPIQLIQFNISTDFVYTQLNVKTVLYQTIQFRVSRVSMSMDNRITITRKQKWRENNSTGVLNSSISNNSVKHKHAV